MSQAVAAKLAGVGGDPCCCEAGICAVQCCSKSGSATLCGFASFGTDDGTRWKKRVLSGTVYSATWNSAGCHQDGGQGGTFTFVITGDPHYTGGGTLIITPYLDGSKHCRLQVTAAIFYEGNPVQWSGVVLAGLNMASGYDSVQNMWALSCPNNVNAYLRSSWGGQIGLWDLHVIPMCGDLPTNSIKDVWDATDNYSPGLGQTPPVCSITPSDISTRNQKAFGVFPLTTGGTPATFPGGLPSDAYGALAPLTSTTPTQKQWDGTDACTSTPPIWTQVQGTVTQVLSLPDSIADAVARETGQQSWVIQQYCSYATTFTLQTATAIAYRVAQVRGIAGNIITPLMSNTNYKVKIFLGSRIAGLGGAWLPIGELNFSFNSQSQPTYTSNWFDVPTPSGADINLEYGVTGCRLDLA